MCMWVEMDVLWKGCSVLCRMYKRGKEVVREVLFVCLFVVVKSQNICFASRSGLEVKPARGGFFCFFFSVNVGLGISRTNVDSQWNPVYNVFHRIFCCENETIRR